MGESDILEAPTLPWPKPPDDKWHRDRAAFLGMLPELLKSHSGRYVAVHDGQVVAVGDGFVDCARAAYGRVGYVPMYIAPVTERPPRVRIPSPRLVRNWPL
jgi:hypothetical protein